jgi:hypothetical protein
MDAENCLTVGTPHAGALISFETPSVSYKKRS